MMMMMMMILKIITMLMMIIIIKIIIIIIIMIINHDDDNRNIIRSNTKLLEFEESNKKLTKQTAFYTLQVRRVKHKVASNLSPLQPKHPSLFDRKTALHN